MGPHFKWDGPFNGSQLNCHKGSGTCKFSFSSASTPRRHHFCWGHPFNWGHSCIVSQINSHKGSGTVKFSYSSASAILAIFAGATPISLQSNLLGLCWYGNLLICCKSTSLLNPNFTLIYILSMVQYKILNFKSNTYLFGQ